jgi:hypothetical protein
MEILEFIKKWGAITLLSKEFYLDLIALKNYYIDLGIREGREIEALLDRRKNK